MEVEIIPIMYREKFADAFTAPTNHQARKLGWSCYLLFFLGNSQGIATIILIALIVPPLISRDLRSRAYFIYFAKPIGRLEYLLGKFSIPAVFLILITTVPALGLFLFAIAMSPDFMVLFDTWDLPFRVIVASATMIVPTVSLALMLSSLTQESRFATFAWFAIWILPGGAYLVMRGIKQGIDGEVLDPNWTLISLFQMINNVQSWIFGVSPMNSSVAGGIILLSVLTIGCWAVLYRRVSAPVNI